MRQPWVLWMASVILIGWGLSIVIDGQALGASSMHTIGRFPPYALAIGLILAGCGGAWDICRKRTDAVSVFLMAPQVAVLLAAGWDCASVIANGAYADATVRPRGFIFRDQFPMIVAVAFHMLAVLDRHTSRLWKRQ